MEKIPANTGAIRNEKGQFVAGVSGNPAGKPKGAVSIVAALKSRLEEVPEGSKKRYLDIFVDKIMEKATKDGDVSMMKDLIDRVDGKPQQHVDHTSKGEKLGSGAHKPEDAEATKAFHKSLIENRQKRVIEESK